MDLRCVSYQTGVAASGTPWVMLKTALSYDRKTGRMIPQRRCLFTVTSDDEKQLASEMQEDIDNGKVVLVDEKHELKDRD